MSRKFIKCVIANTEFRGVVFCLETTKVEEIIKENKKILGSDISKIHINAIPITDNDLQREIRVYKIHSSPDELPKVFIYRCFWK